MTPYFACGLPQPPPVPPWCIDGPRPESRDADGTASTAVSAAARRFAEQRPRDVRAVRCNPTTFPGLRAARDIYLCYLCSSVGCSPSVSSRRHLRHVDKYNKYRSARSSSTCSRSATRFTSGMCHVGAEYAKYTQAVGRRCPTNCASNRQRGRQTSAPICSFNCRLRTAFNCHLGDALLACV